MSTAILAHGKNWELPIPSNPLEIRLSTESEITAEAAGILYLQGCGDLIIFSSGHTAGSDYPSEAQKMREAMYDNFCEAEIPHSKTFLEEDSYDTLTNLRNVKDRMPDLGIDKVILLSIGYHLPRVRRLAKIVGIPFDEALKSDYVLRQDQCEASHLYARKVVKKSLDERSPMPLARTGISCVLEVAGWAMLCVDPEGEHLAKFVTKNLRHANT